jgi:uncharacterized integral membrane protein
MGNLWLKIKVWTRIAIFAVLFLYVILFVANNSSRQVKFWYWINHEANTTVLPLVLWAFCTGVVGSFLVRTTFKTLRQFRDMQERGRTEKMHRELQGMKTKAGMLRPRPDVASSEIAPHEPAE